MNRFIFGEVFVLLRLAVLALLISVLLALIQPFISHTLYQFQLRGAAPPKALSIPVDTVRPSALRDSWHAPRGPIRRHEGIDIFAARGTPVRASSEGIIRRIGESKLGGKVVWIAGPGGHRHYYAHLDSIAHIVVGQRVMRGQLIAYVGNTGNARRTPPHLHYGIYTETGPINPFPLLVRSRPKGSQG